jgi:rubrerythrin
MDIPDFLIMAAELEKQASKIYEALAGLSSDSTLAKRLKTLAIEEINHASILSMGLNYYKQMPDAFQGIRVDDDELWAGLEEAKRFLALLVPGFSLLDGLKRMLDFEKRFEKVHLDTSTKVTEPSLRKLFLDLMRGDQSHILALTELIKSSGGNT